ncbi:formylglycine-generating enzyme family protein [Elusimicrobiota bacterium]
MKTENKSSLGYEVWLLVGILFVGVIFILFIARSEISKLIQDKEGIKSAEPGQAEGGSGLVLDRESRKLLEGRLDIKKHPLHADMVLIPSGEFMMGCPEKEGSYAEHPKHRVYLDGFYIDQYEVTVKKYKAFARATGNRTRKQPKWSADDHPMVRVSWYDAQAFCNHYGKRLPTEAEWEKAARGGSEAKYSFGDDTDLLTEYAWYKINSGRQTHPAGQKKPNQYGLYDMQGNVWEWVSDWFHKKYFQTSPHKNPKGPKTGKFKVIRSGAWSYSAYYCRPGTRVGVKPAKWYYIQGFRCAMDAK